MATFFKSRNKRQDKRQRELEKLARWRAAKASKRMLPPEATKEVRTKIRVRRSKAKWRFQIRDLEHGDSMTILLYRLPWPSRYASRDGKEYSAAEFGKLISKILKEAP